MTRLNKVYKECHWCWMDAVSGGLALARINLRPWVEENKAEISQFSA